MFTDGRSKKVVFLAHCLLNQNAISDGTAVYPSAFQGLIRFFLDNEVGIVQMPCPELCCLGLDRGNALGAQSPVTVENTRIRAAMGAPGPARGLTALVDQVMLQAEEYHRHGFHIVALIGVNRSPCCGVETTSLQDRELPGQGLFVEALAGRLRAAGLEVPLLGVKASDDPSSFLARLRALL